MKRYIRCSNVVFPLDIYEFLDWFNSRNPNYRIYNDDLDLVSCDYSSKTLARFPFTLEISESQAKNLEQRLLDAMHKQESDLHKQESDILSGNIDFDRNMPEDLRKFLANHINDLDEETALKVIDHFNSNIDYSSYFYQLWDIVRTPGLSKAVINKLKSSKLCVKLATENPDLSDKERIEILIPFIEKHLSDRDKKYQYIIDRQFEFLRYSKYVPDEVLRYAVLNGRAPIRELVARRPNLSPDIVDMLKNDKSYVVKGIINKKYN